MPASQFFLMFDQARKLQATYYSRLADIAAIPSCSPQYYKGLKEDLKNEILGWDDPPEQRDEPRPAKSEPLDSSSVEVKNAMTALFQQAKRVNGIR